MASTVPPTNSAQPQPAAAAVVLVPQQVSTQLSSKQQKHQENLKGLALTEVVLGVISVVLGAVVSGIVSETTKNYFHLYYKRYNSYDSYDYSYYRYRSVFTTGEGIWCGVWIIVAGVLGIFAAKKTASRCLIRTHLAFSVIASVACGSMIIVASIGAGVSYFLTSAMVIYIILAIIAFISMVLHIVSASYCCATLACCCSCCSNTNMNYAAGQPVAYGGQVIYHPQPVQPAIGVGGVVYGQQVPTTVQYPGAPNFQQGYVYPGGQPMMQTTFPGTVAPSTNVPPNQPMNLPVAGQENATAAGTKAQEALQSGGGDLPPSYNATTAPQ